MRLTVTRHRQQQQQRPSPKTAAAAVFPELFGDARTIVGSCELLPYNGQEENAKIEIIRSYVDRGLKIVLILCSLTLVLFFPTVKKLHL